jgi:hypothetical protein
MFAAPGGNGSAFFFSENKYGVGLWGITPVVWKSRRKNPSAVITGA